MKTPHPRISVAIPTLGRDEVLVDTLKQVLAQSFRDLELIVVDQSTSHDATTSRFLQRNADARLRYFRVSPASLPAARNFAIARAATKLILFLDDDVKIEPDFVQHHYDALHLDSEIVAVGGRVINQTNTQKLTKRPLWFDRNGMAHETFNCDVSQYGQSFPGGNMSIKKAAIEAIGGFNTSYRGSAEREESDTAARLVRAGGKIYFSAEAAIVHLAAPRGGARIFVPFFDSQQFYANDLLFALQTVRPWHLPLGLAKRYRDAVRSQSLGATLRRSRLFMVGLGMALGNSLRPRHIVSREVTL